MAQLGRALRSGRRGRWFESSRIDFEKQEVYDISCFFAIFGMLVCRGESKDMGRENFKSRIGFILVLSGDYNGAINSLMRKDYHFGLVFMDPPYGRELAEKALIRLKDKAFVSQDTLFVVEAGLQEDFSGMEEEGYSILREKIYKTNKHVFLRLKGEIG